MHAIEFRGCHEPQLVIANFFISVIPSDARNLIRMGMGNG
jgi:hypothetical protein